MTTLIEFRHEVPDALQVLEATEQRLQRLITDRAKHRADGWPDLENEDLAIGQLDRAVRVQRLELYGVADVVDAPRPAVEYHDDRDEMRDAGRAVR